MLLSDVSFTSLGIKTDENDSFHLSDDVDLTCCVPTTRVKISHLPDDFSDVS